MKSLKTLSDKELLNRLTKLVKHELDLTLDILLHLIEVENRRIYRSLGYRSMFVYCTDGLGYSESSACRRIYAARAIRKCPRAYGDLREGRVNLGSLELAWQHLTPELLEEIQGRSYRQVQAIVSRFNPLTKHSDKTRPVSVQRPIETAGERQTAGATSTGSGGLSLAAEPERRPELGDISHRRGGKFSAAEARPVRGDTTTSDKSPAPSAHTIELETVKMHQVNCLVEDDVMQMLDRCRELLSGKHPRGIDYNTLMMEMASDWLEKHDPVRRRERREKRKKTGSSNPTGAPGTIDRKEPSRYIGPATRDAVYNRDKGRCTFVGSTGRRCESRWDLEIHHDETPYAMGGGHSIHNLRLLCASHNMLDAERVYGRRHMEKYVKQQE